MKALLPKVGAAVVSLLITLILLELLLRLFAPGALNNQNIRTYDASLGYKFVPNLDTTVDTGKGPHHLVTNSYGFEGPDFSFEKPQDEYRIENFGDSYVEGVQEVDWDKNLVALLGTDLGGATRSINFGFSGRGTLEEYWSYKYLGAKAHPDLVILWFTIANDFANNYLPPESQAGAVSNSYGGIKYVLKKSALAAFIFERVKGYPAAVHVLQALHLTNAVFTEDKAGVPSFEDEINYSTDPAYAERQEQAYATTKDLLAKFASDAKAENAQFLVVIIPNPLDPLRFFATYPAAMRRDYDFTKAARTLTAILEHEKINYFDLAGPLGEYEKGPTCGTLWGDHFTPCGHQVTAKIVSDYIKTHLVQ